MLKTKKILFASLIVLLFFFVSAKSEVLKAKVDLIGHDGNKVGRVLLTEDTSSMKGVLFKIEIDNLPPGIHGIHIHEFGKADPPDFKTSGGHFNPTNKVHGFKNPKGHHEGDLKNITVDNKGKADVTFYDKDVTLIKGKQNSLLKDGGTSIIIHEKADDYMTDPSGNSGTRIAGGIITETM